MSFAISLIELAQAILRSSNPLAKRGQRLLARKSGVNLAAGAAAPKLADAIWYLLMGRWIRLVEFDGRLVLKRAAGQNAASLANGNLQLADNRVRLYAGPQ